jgi:tetratricopeptide (TPR) repeat protein
MTPQSALLFSALTLTLTPPARADNPEREARILYQKGNAAFKKGDSILARDYYKKSLALYESFDTMCNLGRAQAQDKLYVEAYESLVWCAHLYPEDPELAEARIKFVRLRDEVRTEVSPTHYREIDERVDAELKRRNEAPAMTNPPASGLENAEEEPEPEVRRVKWKMPLVVTTASTGLATVVAGSVVWGRSGGLRREAEDLNSTLGPSDCALSSPPTECADIDEKRNKSDKMHNAGVGLVAAGGGLLATALVFQLVIPKEKTVALLPLEMQPAVAAGREGWSFSLSGKF